MKKSILIIIFTNFLAITALATGYTENLYLCDLGIINSNSTNQLGVDFIQYTQNEKTLSVSAQTTYSTALNKSTRINPAFDRWTPANGLNDISINMESDFYGSQYYLEYCYTWDRTAPSDNINYDVTFISSLPTAVPFTQMSVDTNCSIKANDGAVINTETSKTPVTNNLLTTDLVGMRCTIKLNFKEDSFFIARPHNGDYLGINPNITVKVNP
jgi:hypothetical protein